MGVAFTFMHPVSRVSIHKSPESKKVLDMLERYLKDTQGEPIGFLTQHWADQAAAFTYKELKKMVEDGEPGEADLENWYQDYAAMVEQKLIPMWEEAMVAGQISLQILEGIRGFTFDSSDRAVEDWIRLRGEDFVTDSVEEQRRAIQLLLDHAADDGLSTAEAARYIRPAVGLNSRQAAANIRYYKAVKEQLSKEHPRMKAEAMERRARDLALKYADRQRRQRAETIARTELATAYHTGNDMAVRQAMEQGLLPMVKKVWSTARDDRVCPVCAALEGMEIAMDGQFSFRAGKKGGCVLIPPAHPRCACAVKYEEVKDAQGRPVWSDATVGRNPYHRADTFGGLVANETDSGIINTRDMANGMRKSCMISLTEEDKAFIREEIEKIGADASHFMFRDFSPTGYSDKRDIVFLSSSVFPPADGSVHPTDKLSVRAVLAHEYYGHRPHRWTRLSRNAWNDEFRASYAAAKNCPNLSERDRAELIQDAIFRAQSAGITIKYNKFIRRCLYGYESGGL